MKEKLKKLTDCFQNSPFKLKYQQPHSIKCFDYLENPALIYHLVYKEHRRQKYENRKVFKG